MADLLPSIPDSSAPDDAEPRVVGLDDEDAEDVLGALSSTTARELFAALNEDPAHPSALAECVDTSLQNVQYHLSNLEDAGIVEVVDTAYSEKGREMDVYAPADRPLVLFAGDEEDETLLHRALGRLLGGVGVLAGASLAVRGLAGAGQTPTGRTSDESAVGVPASGDSGDDSGSGDAAAPSDEDASTGGSGDDGAAADGYDGGDGATGDDGAAAGDDGGAATDSSATDGEAEMDDGGAGEGDQAMDDGSDATDSSDATDGSDVGDVDGSAANESDVGGSDGSSEFDGAADGQGSGDGAGEGAVEPLAQDLAWIADPLDASALPPELVVFLLGGCLLAVGVGAWYWRKRQTGV